MDAKQKFLKAKDFLFAEPMTDETRELLTEFIESFSERKMSHTSKRNYVESLIFFTRVLNKKHKKPCEISKIDKKDIRTFLNELEEHTYITQSGKTKCYEESTKRKHRVTIKYFLNYLKKDDLAQMLNTKRVAPKLPKNIITNEEADMLIEAAKSTRDKALIATLHESGARIGEILSCNIDSLEFDEEGDGCSITFPQGKTGPRRVLLINSSSYLRIWLDNHPHKDCDPAETPLWCVHGGPCKRLESGGVSYMLRRVAKKTGFKKKVNPHAFRHAAATNLASHLTEQQMKIYLGWTKGSDMPAIYVHLSGKDVDDAIRKMNGVEPEDAPQVLKPGKCPRCKEMNDRTAGYCKKCGFALKKGAEQILGADLCEVDAVVMQTMMDDPAFAAKMCEMAKRLTMSNQLK